MTKLDSRIYGSDDNGMASSIASDALNPANSENWAGDPTGEEGAKGNGGNPDSKVVVKNVGGGSDSRACPSGNHGKSGCRK
jgi:hypothetical protein